MSLYLFIIELGGVVMKKINPFKLYACLIVGFFLSLALIVSIMINIIWQVNSLDYHTYSSVDAFKESELTPFYNMYDAYEYIFNDKEILMSDKQHYIIDHHYPNEYFMKDVGSAKVNARYSIQFRFPDGALNYYEHNSNSNLTLFIIYFLIYYPK
jgi:hypothetical protein